MLVITNFILLQLVLKINVHWKVHLDFILNSNLFNFLFLRYKHGTRVLESEMPMSKKAMTFVLVLAAVLLLSLLFLRPEKNKQIYDDLNDENEIYDIAQEIIFEEAPLVVEVTEINSDYMVAYEYSSDQEFVGDIEKLDLSSYENTHNEITYSFPSKEYVISL